MTQSRITKLFLITVYVALAAILFLYKKNFLETTPFEYLLMALAVFRLGNLMSFDLVSEPLRSYFVKTIHDPTGAGDSTCPCFESGWQRSIGELWCCPTCVMHWAALVIVYAWVLVHEYALIPVLLVSLPGAGELMNAVKEYFEWNGQAARELAGSENIKKNGRTK